MKRPQAGVEPGGVLPAWLPRAVPRVIAGRSGTERLSQAVVDIDGAVGPGRLPFIDGEHERII